MPRTKRSSKTRARTHNQHVKAERKKRIRAAGGTRTAKSRSTRRARRLAAKVARNK